MIARSGSNPRAINRTYPVTLTGSNEEVKNITARDAAIATNRVTVAGVELVHRRADQHDVAWLDFDHCVQRLEAAWLRPSPKEPPLNPRVIGEPGLGKTTLACAVARKLGQPVYIFQCTMDTRPEDLVITPVLTPDRRVEYHASSVVSAMLTGGIAVLDEGNRMPERAWASLAPLMDDRRYVESTIASVKVAAHSRFRLCVTMNQDSSVYELPGYIQSRLKPRIDIVAPPWELQERILRLKCPAVDAELLAGVFTLLKSRVKRGLHDSTRDMLSLAQYAQKLKQTGVDRPLKRAADQILKKAVSSAPAAAGTRSPLVRRFQHLMAVPSFHYDGVFGRVVHEVFATAPPQVVALELPPEMRPELAWAATCWPGSVVSIATTRGTGAAATTLPFVPGDSIVEAFRLATAAGIPVACVDANVVTSAGERAGRADRLPGAELAGRTGIEYVALAEALMSQRPAGPSALTREAVMAGYLAALMEDYASVLWVGGLAHWSRIEARLRAADFSAPAVPTAPPLKWRRGRLAPSALHRMTGQSPWKVQSFAASPQTFDPLALVLGMLHEAGPEGIVGVDSVPEPCSAVDRARVGIYARNLAATDGLREEPQLSELVVAARNVVGPRYAARVYHLGMTEQATARSSVHGPPHVRRASQTRDGWLPLPRTLDHAGTVAIGRLRRHLPSLGR